MLKSVCCICCSLPPSSLSSGSSSLRMSLRTWLEFASLLLSLQDVLKSVELPYSLHQVVVLWRVAWDVEKSTNILSFCESIVVSAGLSEGLLDRLHTVVGGPCRIRSRFRETLVDNWLQGTVIVIVVLPLLVLQCCALSAR